MTVIPEGADATLTRLQAADAVGGGLSILQGKPRDYGDVQLPSKPASCAPHVRSGRHLQDDQPCAGNCGILLVVVLIGIKGVF
jgi:hypothetical protein